MIERQNTTGIILAGGKSSRMGSDKASIVLHGQAFIKHVIKAAKPLVEEMLIVSKHPNHRKFGLPVIKDVLPLAGPLSGLCAGLKHSSTDFNLVMSCDIPFIGTETLQLLTDTDPQDDDVILLADENHVMPLIALYHKRCLNPCLRNLEEGERRLLNVLSQLNVRRIPIPEHLKYQIENINTPEQLAKHEQKDQN